MKHIPWEIRAIARYFRVPMRLINPNYAYWHETPTRTAMHTAYDQRRRARGRRRRTS